MFFSFQKLEEIQSVAQLEPPSIDTVSHMEELKGKLSESSDSLPQKEDFLKKLAPSQSMRELLQDLIVSSHQEPYPPPSTYPT